MSDKIDVAIDRLKTASEMSLNFYNEPLMITYSGGKDSDCLLQLAIMSGIPIEVVHSHTTADAPETVRYVRQVFKELDEKGYKTKIEYPYYKGKRTSMWDLIVKKGFPLSDGKLDIHHIVPVSQGGGDEPSNLITLCRECHKKRHKEAEEEKQCL